MQSRTPTKKILILAANPTDTARLRLDEEEREIHESLWQSRKRDQFDLKKRPAVRVKDIRRALLHEKPQIVHFCGHGHGVNGLAVENDRGETHLFPTEALAYLFRAFQTEIECVVLNACYSEVQAAAISRYIPYVVGMSQEIGDRTAIHFAEGFYDALGDGRSYREAYEFGCNAIESERIPLALIPKLYEEHQLYGERLSAIPSSPSSVQPSPSYERPVPPKRAPGRGTSRPRSPHRPATAAHENLWVLVQRIGIWMLPIPLIWALTAFYFASPTNDAQEADYFALLASGALAGGASGLIGSWTIRKFMPSFQWDQLLLNVFIGIVAGSIIWWGIGSLLNGVSPGLLKSSGGLVGLTIGLGVAGCMGWGIHWHLERNRPS
jgi:hypothetical protein